MAKRELLATIRDRYLASSKKDKSRILDEFIAVTGHHRKHGIRLLGQSDGSGDKPPTVRGRRIYDEAVREALIVIWEAADRICGKRLKAALPYLAESMERHGHLDLDLLVRPRLLSASAATPDRLLKPIRPTAGRRLRRLPAVGRMGLSSRSRVAALTDSNSLVATAPRDRQDSKQCLSWPGNNPWMVAGLEAIGQQLPFPIRGIDVSKDRVDVAVRPTGRTWRVDYEEAGVEAGLYALLEK